jgi:2-oxoglutarate ferredoxin oxidoreductase subunit beta
VGRDYDPTNRESALAAIHKSHETGEILTGILYVDPAKPDLKGLLGMVDEPLHGLPMERLRPPQAALDAIMESMR